MLSTIAYLLGLVVAVTIFLNLLTAKDSLKTGKKKSSEKKGPETLDAKKVFQMKFDKENPRPRICPVCGTLLNQTEYLIASIEPEKEGQKRQAHIYGCRYCFTTDGVNLELTKMEP